MKLTRFPLLIFAGLVIVMSVGLTMDPQHIPSPLIGKPAPVLKLPYLEQSPTAFDTRKVGGKVWILNVWASWCSSCRAEHKLMRRLVEDHKVMLVGLNYKDEREPAKAWLLKHGNPYDYTLRDSEGQAGIEWGVYAVPETFVIDKQGIIRYKHVGPLNNEEIKETVIPLLARLQRGR